MAEPYDAADPERIAAAEQAVKDRDEQRRRFELAMMSSSEGRDWFWQLLKDCHVLEKRISMTGDRETDFLAGEREVGIRLMVRLARSAPQFFGLMMAEQNLS